MMKGKFFEIFRWYVWGAGLLFACLLIVLTGIAWSAIQPENRLYPVGTALVQLIPAPSDTPVLPTFIPTETPAEIPGTPPPPPPGVISIGAYVQIRGTGSDGLRFRSEPSLQGAVRFVAIEAEVFRVVDGPREADGYTWWYLVAPYDENLKGWCVSNYLQVVQNPD